MKVFQHIDRSTEWALEHRDKGRTIGFVPTMGALHAGHLALAQQARRENDIMVCSIFVNPLQFDKPDDLESYPRTLEDDLRMLESVACDAVFCPEVSEMYSGQERKSYDFGHLDKVMEGCFRPGHFNGVAIVVDRLFGIIRPHRAYFGEKDYQQLQVIRAMAQKEGHDITIIGCPTYREPDGLALSSRNRRLSGVQRREAPRIYQALLLAKELYPDCPVEEIRARVAAFVNDSPELTTEYIDIVWADTLLPVDRPEKGREVRACIAAYAGTVRLIDNLSINT